MSINIVRAWKDAEYRNSLSVEELSMVPANPVGEIELHDEDLASVVGARKHQDSESLEVLGITLLCA